MKTFILKLYSYKGRISGSTFSYTYFGLGVILGVIVGLIRAAYPVVTPPIQIFTIIILFIFGYPIVCSIIKRFHDLNRSGFYLLAFLVVILVPIVNLIMILILIFKKGEYKPNKYGESPYVTEVSEVTYASPDDFKRYKEDFE